MRCRFCSGPIHWWAELGAWLHDGAFELGWYWDNQSVHAAEPRTP